MKDNNITSQHCITKVKPNFLNRENLCVAVFLLLSFVAGSLIGILINGGVSQ